MKKLSMKVTAMILVLLCVLSLASCKSRPIKTSKDALVSVGTVGNYDVTYEEIYFLANNYKDMLDAKYGPDSESSDEIILVSDDNGEIREAVLSEYYYETLLELISENITSNYAVLTLAEKMGISMNDKDVQDEIQRELDLYIASEFGGERKEYKKYLEEYHMTDNYVRFCIGVDVLYSRLTTEYLSAGDIENDDDKIREKINEEFIRTWHVMIINDDKADQKRANDVLEKVRSGEESMYTMIGRYSEDFQSTTLDGYYFTKGTMDKAYEDAAYALEVGEFSDVIVAIGDDYYGNRVPCYYVIQRLELDQAYIDKHFDTLKTEYINSIAYEKMESVESTLEFTPNDYYDSLDLLTLEAPRQIDTFTITIVSLCVVGAAIIVGGIIFWIYYQKKKIRKRKNGKKRV